MKRIIIGAAVMAAAICTTSCRFVRLDEGKFGGFDNDFNVTIGETGTKGTIKGSDKTTTIYYSDLDKIVALSIDGSTDIKYKNKAVREY